MSSGTLGGSVPGGSTTVREASGGQEHHLIQRFYAVSPQRRFLNPCTSRSRGAPSLRIAKSYVTLTSVRMRERTDGTKPQEKKGVWHSRFPANPEGRTSAQGMASQRMQRNEFVDPNTTAAGFCAGSSAKLADHDPDLAGAVRRAQEGDHEAIRYLYLRFKDNVYGYVLSVVR